MTLSEGARDLMHRLISIGVPVSETEARDLLIGSFLETVLTPSQD